MISHTFADVFVEGGAPETLAPFVERAQIWPRETLTAHAEILSALSYSRGRYAALAREAAEALEIRKLEKLRHLVTFAYEHVPYYGRLYQGVGFEIGDLKTLEDFGRLPILHKADLRAMHDEIAAAGKTTVQFKSRTSGSTGQPVSLINDSERMRHWFITRILMFEDMMGTRLRPADWIHSIYYEPFLLSSIFGGYRTFTVGLRSRPEELAEHIRLLRPRIVTGVASHVLRVAALLPDAVELGIRAMTTNSESSSRSERLKASRLLGGVPVLDEYSSEELGIIAWEQRDGTYLAAEDTVHLELVSEGADGLASVVGTDLFSFTMPRIRYAQGDYAEWHDEHPERGMRRLKRIIGRQDMILVSPSKGTIDPGRILEIADQTIVAETAGIEEFRLVQKAATNITLVVRPAPTAQEEGMDTAIQRFRSQFLDLFGPSQFVVDVVASLPSLGVKRRCIVRETYA